MRQLLATYFIIQCIIIHSQVTISSSDMVSGSDTVMVSVVTDFQNINYSTAGANVTWDFSSVQIESQRIDTFYNPSTLSFVYQLIFNSPFNPNYNSSYYQKESNSIIPSSGLPFTVSNPISFSKLSSNKLEFVGFGADINGTPIPIQADTIDLVYQLPMTYQDNWVSNAYFFVDVNPIYNAKFKRYQERVSEVDGHGTVITAYGSFSCIRVKASLTYVDSVFVDLLGTGGSWFALPPTSEVEYVWWATGQKIPVFSLIASTTTGTEIISSVEFKDNLIDVTGLENYTTSSFKLYPNPARQFITIELENLTGIESIECYAADGKLIYSQRATQKNITLDTEQWNQGIYFLKLKSNDKSFVQKFIVH